MDPRVPNFFYLNMWVGYLTIGKVKIPYKIFHLWTDLWKLLQKPDAWFGTVYLPTLRCNKPWIYQSVKPILNVICILGPNLQVKHSKTIQ